MTYATNPAFREVFHSKVHNVRFYIPADGEGGYHVCRTIGAEAQNIYSQSGATKETLVLLLKRLEALFEDENSKTKLRTDGILIVQNLLYRTSYPLDEECMIRMGALLTFMESETYGHEDHDSLNAAITERKVMMAKSDPDLYTFFLTLGASNTPAYGSFLDISLNPSYLNSRREALQSMTPQHLFPTE